MCIYYKDRQCLTYVGQEHIFPAGIGGILKLPMGYVSDQFNNNISKLELQFLRESFISVARQIEGPGKRGSLSENKATQSLIHLIVDAKHQKPTGIGYVKIGQVFEIPSVLINKITNEFTFGVDKKNQRTIEQSLQFFIDKCKNPEKLIVKKIEDERIDINAFFFGIEENVDDHFSAFFACHPNNKTELSNDIIKNIGSSLERIEYAPQAQNYMPSSRLTAKFSEEYFRISGKVALNFLAYVKGKEIVLNSEFDPLRKWITGTGSNNFAMIDSSPNVFQNLLPRTDQSFHYVIIQKTKAQLFATVCFYGASKTTIKLSDNYSSPFTTDGLICDWKNRKEYRFMEFMNFKFS